MSEKLNPSPKIPNGEYPELSPNPNYTDGYIEGEHGIGRPTNPNQEPLAKKPEVLNGLVYVNGKLFINGKDVEEMVGNELPLITLAEDEGTLKNEQYILTASDHCLIKYNGQYFYKSNEDAYYLIFEGATEKDETETVRNVIQITKSSKAYTLIEESIADVIETNPSTEESDPILRSIKIKGNKYRIPLDYGDGVQFNFINNANYTLSASANYASYLRVVGQVLYFVASFNITKDTIGTGSDPIVVGTFSNIPTSIFNKLVGNTYLDEQNTQAYVDGTFTKVNAATALVKGSNNDVSLRLETTNLTNGVTYHIRHVSVFLLTSNFFQPDGIRIEGLGDSTPTNVTFSASANFPSESALYEEVVKDGSYFAKYTPWYKKPIFNGAELIGFEISNVKEDDDYKIYDCFLDENGNVLPYILLGQYYCTSTTTASSVSGTAATMTIGAGRTLCRAKGTGYQQMDGAMFNFWRDLALACSKRVNFNDGSGVANYLGLKEMTQGGWWIDGLTHVNSKYLYCYKPSKYVDQPTSSSDGYDELSYDMPTTNGLCISKLGYDPNHPTINMPSAGVSNSSFNTYYCDGVYYDTGNRPCNVTVGRADADYGLFYLDGHNAWSFALRVRLCWKPSIAA